MKRPRSKKYSIRCINVLFFAESCVLFRLYEPKKLEPLYHFKGRKLEETQEKKLIMNNCKKNVSQLNNQKIW